MQAKADLAQQQAEIAKQAAEQKQPEAAKAAAKAAEAIKNGDIPKALENQAKALQQLQEAAKNNPMPMGDPMAKGEPQKGEPMAKGLVASPTRESREVRRPVEVIEDKKKDWEQPGAAASAAVPAAPAQPSRGKRLAGYLAAFVLVLPSIFRRRKRTNAA